MKINVDFPCGFHLWKKNVFSTATSHISPKVCMLNCALLYDSSLLIAKDKKSEVFSYFKNIECEFLPRSHTIYFNKGLSNPS